MRDEKKRNSSTTCAEPKPTARPHSLEDLIRTSESCSYFVRALIGMSCVTPLGRARLMEIGSASSSSSADAISIAPLYAPSSGMKGGAPIAICSDLAPMILAFSNLVSFGGPILISKVVREGCLALRVDFGGAKTEPRSQYVPFSVV